jgi:hypothetical protein
MRLSQEPGEIVHDRRHAVALAWLVVVEQPHQLVGAYTLHAPDLDDAQ